MVKTPWKQSVSIAVMTSAIEEQIYVIRGVGVMMDADLASLYGVPTKRLNEQVKRNKERFPADFMFRLTSEEAQQLSLSRSHSATLNRGKNIKYAPYAFTEHGAIMLASVLNSAVAIDASIPLQDGVCCFAPTAGA